MKTWAIGCAMLGLGRGVAADDAAVMLQDAVKDRRMEVDTNVVDAGQRRKMTEWFKEHKNETDSTLFPVIEDRMDDILRSGTMEAFTTSLVNVDNEIGGTAGLLDIIAEKAKSSGFMETVMKVAHSSEKVKRWEGMEQDSFYMGVSTLFTSPIPFGPAAKATVDFHICMNSPGCPTTALTDLPKVKKWTAKVCATVYAGMYPYWTNQKGIFKNLGWEMEPALVFGSGDFRRTGLPGLQAGWKWSSKKMRGGYTYTFDLVRNASRMKITDGGNWHQLEPTPARAAIEIAPLAWKIGKTTSQINKTGQSENDHALDTWADVLWNKGWCKLLSVEFQQVP